MRFLVEHATVWFSTPFLVLSGAFSFLYILVARWDRPKTSRPLPPYPAPETREDLFLILGERHRQTSPQRASAPTWLTIPERGLYTGMVIVGAIGTGKTLACMYPYVEQSLDYRARDPVQKLADPILEVKGDFCAHLCDMLARGGRAGDYVEINLASPYRHRGIIERTIAWFGAFRRLLIRHERSIRMFLAFFQLAAAPIALRKS